MNDDIKDKYILILKNFSHISIYAPSIVQECNDYYCHENKIYRSDFDLKILFNYINKIDEMYNLIQSLFDESYHVLDESDLREIAKLRSDISALKLIISQYRPAYKIEVGHYRAVKTFEEYKQKLENNEIVEPQSYHNL